LDISLLKKKKKKKRVAWCQWLMPVIMATRKRSGGVWLKARPGKNETLSQKHTTHTYKKKGEDKIDKNSFLLGTVAQLGR
jgi:hypothetical protein